MTHRTLIERLARHLAADRPDTWTDHIEHAASLLAILKDPDEAMREAGDETHWRAMVDAALRARWTLAQAGSSDTSAGGTDEEGEIDLTPAAVSHDHADWVHMHSDATQQDKGTSS